MSKIVFFSIPAYGHTNPTIAVVRELTSRGHEVWYYSFDTFKERIENAGARYISCDAYLPEARPDDEKKIGKDFAALIEMAADTTINLDERVCRELGEFQPDCIVSDSICIWGKLFARKLNIPYVCSTTTFAFNSHTAKILRGKQGLGEIIRTIIGMPRINRKIKELNQHGYAVPNLVFLIQNDNDTNTIVFTSREFQPLSETFSDKYSFVGPSINHVSAEAAQRERAAVYISLGTVLNKNLGFYANCIQALKESSVDVVMSVGDRTDIAALGPTPANFEVAARVEQIKVLQKTDVFLTHCGMNSVNESLYYGVPMVLFPQQSEQAMVADRVAELGAGIMLRKNAPRDIKAAIDQVLSNDVYKSNADRISRSFKTAGGAKKAADAILKLQG